jgi:hypothetical protein
MGSPSQPVRMGIDENIVNGTVDNDDDTNDDSDDCDEFGSNQMMSMKKRATKTTKKGMRKTTMNTMTKRRKGLATTCNNKSRTKTMTINHDDLLLSVKDGNADSGDDDDNDKLRQYKKSMPNEWTMHIDGNTG